jgi:hypothetical protein
VAVEVLADFLSQVAAANVDWAPVNVATSPSFW